LQNISPRGRGGKINDGFDGRNTIFQRGDTICGEDRASRSNRYAEFVWALSASERQIDIEMLHRAAKFQWLLARSGLTATRDGPIPQIQHGRLSYEAFVSLVEQIQAGGTFNPPGFSA
jgi:hypothetical protein